jgi:DNA modification methylase
MDAAMITILTGDCRSVLRTLPEASVQCVVTSPPYWGLRDYGTAGQLWLEASPDAYVATMVAVFREVRRVLCNDGTLWLNLGDSYASGEMGRHDHKQAAGICNGEAIAGRARIGNGMGEREQRKQITGLPSKNLIGIPWRVAFALQEDGWYLRQDIIWSKPNPMPESVTDRCTKAHEYLFLLAKSPRYYFDAEAIAEDGSGRTPGNRNYKYNGLIGHETKQGILAQADIPQMTRNKRSVWEVTTQPFSEAHFATFPPALIEPCIKAGTSERGCCAKCGAPWVRQVERGDAQRIGGATGCLKDGKATGPMDRGGNGQWDNEHLVKVRPSTTLGWSPSCKCDAATVPVPCTVLDCFGGAGTTGMVADRLQRNAILIELNPAYANMSERRIVDDAPLFVEVAP